MASVNDYAIALRWIDRRDNTVGRSIEGVLDLKVSISGEGPGSIEFKLPGSHQLVPVLPGMFEVSVRVWRRSIRKWVEPANCRFIVNRLSAEVGDSTQNVTYIGSGVSWVFDKIVTLKSSGSAKLLAAEKSTKERMDAVKKSMDRAASNFNSHLTSVRSRLKGSKGKNLTGSKFPASAKAGSILYHTRNRKLYRRTGGRWVTSGITSSEVSKARTLYSSSASWKKHYATAKANHERALRAGKAATRGGRRPYLNATPGRVLYELWTEARARGNRLPHFSRGFTQARDSNGQRWAVRRDFESKLGGTLLDVLEQLREEGVIEWRMRGRVLEVVNPGGFDRDVRHSVGLALGKDLFEGTDKQSAVGHASYTLLMGEGERAWGTLTPRGSYRTEWGVFEQSISVSKAKTASEARGETSLERTRARTVFKRERIRGVRLHADSPAPLLTYYPGCLVRVQGHDGYTTQKVAQVTVSKRNSSYEAAVVFDDTFSSKALVLGKSVQAILPGTSASLAGGQIPKIPDRSVKLPPQIDGVAVDYNVGYDDVAMTSKISLLVSVSPQGLLGVAGGGVEEDTGYEV